jgi:hypothetical protein
VLGASREEQRKYPYTTATPEERPPELAVPRSEDVKRIQREAEGLVEQAYREQTERAALSVAHISDIARITRTEGAALGAAFRLHPLTSFDVDVGARYGFSDEEAKGSISIAHGFRGGRALRAYAGRDYADVRDVREASGIRNSVAAQEFGSDYTDPIDLRTAGIEITLGRLGGLRWRVDGAFERHDALSVVATPERGVYEPTIPAQAIEGVRASIRFDGLSAELAGGRLRGGGELRLLDFSARDTIERDSRAARLSVDFEFQRRLGSGTLATRTSAVALSGGPMPPQFFAYLGGPVTAPGYRFDDFASRHALAQRVEWGTIIPFVPISLGRFGQVPPRAGLALFAHSVWVNEPARSAAGFVRGDRQGWYPAVGIGFLPLLGLVRFDVARGLHDGRWTFSFDLARSFWPIL